MASGGNSTSVAFGQQLQRLKQRGCNLLVVGSVPDSVLSLASHQMLGDPNLRRHRLFVLTDTDASTARGRLPAASTRSMTETTKIVNHVPSARSTATHAGTRTARIPEDFVYDEGLDALYESIEDAIAEFERREGEFDPGRLRLCFDSLRPLLDEYDREEILGFLDRLTSTVRGVRGMAHFVLPVGRDSESVDRLAGHFDAVVELRTINDSREQERWYLPEEDLTTDWITL